MWIRGASWPLIAGAMIASLSACGGGADRPTVVPVSGKILFKGQPVEGARVGFHSQGSSPRVASGTTDSQGQFKLTTFDTADGAVPGEHVVTIFKPEETAAAQEEMSAENPDEAYHKAMTAATHWKPTDVKSKLPTQYASAESSPERRTVSEEGPNEFTIELSP